MDERNKRLWDHIAKVAEEVKTWPAWKKGSPVNRREVTPPKPIEGELSHEEHRRACMFNLPAYVFGTSPKPLEPRRHARIICDATGCGEWNCDDCHPETKFPKPIEPPQEIACCIACEGSPVHPNDPCGLCGRSCEPKPAPQAEIPPQLVSSDYLRYQVVRYGLESKRVKQVAGLEVEIEKLRELCACAYQFAGSHDAPAPWLDALSAASEGKPFSTENLLPCVKGEGH